jgi:hypothetical protein
MKVNIDKAKAEKVFNDAALIALTMAGISMVSKAKSSLTESGKRDRGDLINSLGYKVKVAGKESNTVSLQDDGQENNTVIAGTNKEYAPYIEKGTGPHRTDYKKEEFAENMKGWFDRHGIIDPKIRFLIIRAIRRRGTTAYPFLRPALDSVSPKVEAMFVKAFKQVTRGSK